MRIEVDSDRVSRELEQLAQYSDAPPPAVTRIVFSQRDQQAREWLKAQCRKAGLSVREDAVGNTFARWVGSEPELPAVGSGSHIDAIPHSGRYDGTVGVLGALEAIRALQSGGFTPRRSVELLLFTSEEPTRFGLGCLGSRLLSGALHHTKGAALVDESGTCLDQVRRSAGFTEALSSVRLPSGYYSGFVELHIEQGPILESSGLQIGIVTSIAAPASLRIVIDGEGGHAGSVLMPQRRDALTAGAELILAIENLALGTGSADTVATTGVCEVFPGAVNSIPSRVALLADVRDTDRVRRDSVLELIGEAAQAIAARRKTSISIEVLNADHPAQCDPNIVEQLETSCREENAGCMRMVSRAYHDSLFMSQVVPTAMLFIPCRKGVSHRPEEYASPPDIVTGIRVLARTIAKLTS